MITCVANFVTVVVLFVQQTKIRDGNIDSNVLNWFTRSGVDGFDQVGELGLFVLINLNCHVFFTVLGGGGKELDLCFFYTYTYE